MKEIVSLSAALCGIGLAATGCYGFVNDLPIWGAPMLLSVPSLVLSRVFLLDN